MRRILIIVFLLAMSFITVTAADAVPTESCTTKSNENSLMRKINQARDNNDRQSLAKDLSLTRVGRHYSGKMIAGGYFEHSTDPPSPHPNSFHLTTNFSAWGENLGRGGSVNSIFQEMMNSSEHRENILASRWDYVGAGIKKNSNDVLYVTVLFWDGSNPGVRNFQSC